MRRFVLSLLLVSMVAFVWAERDARSGLEHPQRLVVCVDGVPFSDFDHLKRQGRFPYIRSFGRLVSSYPSLTNAAMVQILGALDAPLSPGYEDYYYSLPDDRMEGGLWHRLSPAFVTRSFRKAFDFHPPGIVSSFEYVVAPWTCRGIAELDLAGGLRAFRRSRKETFLLYVGPTDCAAHTGGRKAVVSLMKKLDSELEKLLQHHPGVEVSLFSDHGNFYGKHRRVKLGKVLRENGYRMDESLKRNNSVVIPRFGLVGAAAVFVRTSDAHEVARVLSGVDAVDLVTVRLEDSVVLWKEGRSSEIRLLPDKRLVYLPGQVDALAVGREASLSAEDWFKSLQEHPYPDGVNRVWNQSLDAVFNAAQVVVSLKDGYYVGNQVMDVFVALKATHGSLSAGQSLGFAASTDREIPAYLKTPDAWDYLAPSSGIPAIEGP